MPRRRRWSGLGRLDLERHVQHESGSAWLNDSSQTTHTTVDEFFPYNTEIIILGIGRLLYD